MRRIFFECLVCFVVIFLIGVLVGNFRDAAIVAVLMTVSVGFSLYGVKDVPWLSGKRQHYFIDKNGNPQVSHEKTKKN